MPFLNQWMLRNGLCGSATKAAPVSPRRLFHLAASRQVLQRISSMGVAHWARNLVATDPSTRLSVRHQHRHRHRCQQAAGRAAQDAFDPAGVAIGEQRRSPRMMRNGVARTRRAEPAVWVGQSGWFNNHAKPPTTSAPTKMIAPMTTASHFAMSTQASIPCSLDSSSGPGIDASQPRALACEPCERSSPSTSEPWT